jgi:sugar lactone lactonase YvrE
MAYDWRPKLYASIFPCMNTSRFAVLAGLALSMAVWCGCAETAAPPPAPEEVVVVLNGTGATLSLLPVVAPIQVSTIPLGASDVDPVSVTTRGATAVVPLRRRDAIAVVDLRLGQLVNTIPLEPGAGVAGAALVNDSIVYVSNAKRNTITRVDLSTGDTASIAVGNTPQQVTFTRGRLLVMNTNLDSLGKPAGESWISVVDPAAGLIGGLVDSIPLIGPGNAQFSTVAGDGLVYVVQDGDPSVDEGRLSVVDPVRRQELASFGGFGFGPGDLTADGGDRLLISSRTEGLMEFDTAERAVVRGEGNGVAIPANTGVAVDGQGRVYALEAGCSDKGVVHILRPDFTKIRTVAVGQCATQILLARVPPPGVEATDDPGL